MSKLNAINKKWGFWGTMKLHAQTIEQVQDIWNLTMERISELYPEKNKAYIRDILNSQVGRHFAEYLLDNPGGFHFGVVAMKILMLNKISMIPWLTYYRLGEPGQVGQVNEPLLYRAAIRSLLQYPDIYDKVSDLVGCKLTKPVWENPEQWIDSENVTASELKTLWLMIQNKVA